MEVDLNMAFAQSKKQQVFLVLFCDDEEITVFQLTPMNHPFERILPHILTQ